LAAPYGEQVTAEFPATLILHGDQDAVVPVSEARALKARLDGLGVENRMEILAGEGHWFSAAAQMRILGSIGAFLGKAFEVRT
jgi:dipeptidyl aminopeptidase/acylaminoacyl peptidase